MSEDVFAPDVPTLVARIEAFIGPIGDYAAKVRAAGGVAAMEPHTRWHVEGTPETFVRAPPGERGYALGKGFDLTTEGAPFLLRVLRACEGESAGTRRADDPLRTFNDGWTAERFERDETGWPTVKEYDHDGRNCDRDKVSLRNGQTRYFRDDRGRLQRGTVYTNMNSMWMVVFGGSVTYMSGCYLFSCERPDLEPRRVMPGQKERLRDELAKAVAASNFRRVEVLARVLRGFSDAKARKAA